MLGRDVEIEVTNVAHGGISVGRLDGRVVFVSDAIPGETVLARISDDRKRSFWRADTVRVIEPSEHRRDHVWAEASVDRDPDDRPGGAEFGHIELSHQRELKRRVLTESIRRMAKLEADAAVEPLPGEPDGTAWRTRLRLHVDEEGRVGPYAARSHRVIPVGSLPLATAEARAIAPLGERFVGAEQVDVVVPSAGNPFVLQGHGRRAPKPKAQRIVERVGEREFRLDVRGFWQVHRRAAETLSEAVRSSIDAELLDPRAANLDLYGGVGLLAAAMGEVAGRDFRVTTVESDAVATDHAAENLADWVGVSAVTARVERYLDGLLATAGARERERLSLATVVLDPPRSGAGAAVVAALAELAPAQLIYVACDPVALARDLGLFAERGYRLEALRAFDLFPNTHHVEAVARLVRG